MKYRFYLIHRWIYRLIWMIFHPRIMLNAKKYVPVGMYCYEITGSFNMQSFSQPIKVCRFYCAPNFFDWDHQNDLCLYNGSDCCMDACKTCNINKEYND